MSGLGRCSRVLMLLLAAVPADGAEVVAESGAEITLTLVGDTGFGGSLQPVDPARAYRHGDAHPYDELTRAIAPELSGDLAFANLETVVTASNALEAQRKPFVFRTHPNGVRHLLALGFNLLSTANNHAGDYGLAGIEETIGHLERLEDAGLKAFAGVGRDREAAGRPRSFEVKGARLALSAIGIGPGRTNAPGASPRPGQLAYADEEDFAEAVARLGRESGYRVLSVHYGTELAVTPDAEAVRKLRDLAVRGAGIDLVIGHHAHVAAGVADIGGRLVFYGFGNFLHLGTQDMARFDTCRDYGLLARVHLSVGTGGRLVTRAVEIVPLTGMHLAPRRMAPAPAIARLRLLNGLAAALDAPEAGAKGVRFRPQSDGTGLYCFAGAGEAGGRIGELCRGWIEPDADTLARLANPTCARSVAVVERRAGPSRRKARRARSPAGVPGPFGF